VARGAHSRWLERRIGRGDRRLDDDVGLAVDHALIVLKELGAEIGEVELADSEP
jgi:hypothetical protein